MLASYGESLLFRKPGLKMANSHLSLFTDLYWLTTVASVESFYCQHAYLYSVDNFSTL